MITFDPLTILLIEQENIAASQSNMERLAPNRNGKMREIVNPDTLIQMGVLEEEEAEV